ncbi:hypothetical protein MBLNU230_g0501t1 [Neophaeotheca triangularis]
MSLVQRVTSIEGTDRELPAQFGGGGGPDNFSNRRESASVPFRPNFQPNYGSINNNANGFAGGYAGGQYGGYGSVKSIRRVISYDAIPKPHEDTNKAVHPTGGISAWKVSPSWRFAQVTVTVLACWLASGIVFGFAALKPILVDQGVYREMCTPEEIKLDVKLCYEQDLRLNLFFAIASTTCNVSALPVGTILDRYGPRLCAIIGSVCLAIGSLLMAYAFYIPEFDGYIAGNIFLALGGTFIFVPSFSIANAFPKFSGTIVATVTGAFDASAAVFLLFRIVYDGSGQKFTPDKFFFGYLIVPALILLAQIFVMPRDGYKTITQLEEKIEKAQDTTRDVHDSDDEIDSDGEVARLRRQRRVRRESKLTEIESLIGDVNDRKAKEEHEEEVHHTSGVWGVLHGKAAHEQMLSPWFILITLLTVLQMLRMNYFIATIEAQYTYMLGSQHAARRINTFFDVALPIGGVAATPVIGFLLDSISTGNLLAILVAMTTAIGLFGSLPYAWAGYVNVVLFVLLRPLYYSAMSDYAAKVFGFATFGRVYGTIICFSGLVNLFQPAIDAATHDVFNDNPIPTNAFMAGLGLLFGVMLVVYVKVQGSREQKRMEDEDEQASRLVIEEDPSEYDFD